MRTKRSGRGRIPASVVKQLSRELSAFEPDLATKAKFVAVAPEAFAIPGEPSRRGRKQPQGRMLMSLAPAETWWDRKLAGLLRRASELRDKYRNNPYIEVTGFSVTIGMSPSLTIAFNFK